MSQPHCSTNVQIKTAAGHLAPSFYCGHQRFTKNHINTRPCCRSFFFFFFSRKYLTEKKKK